MVSVEVQSTHNYFFMLLLRLDLHKVSKLLKKNKTGSRLLQVSSKKRIKYLVDKKKSVKVGNSRYLIENLFLKIRKLKIVEQFKLDNIQ